MLRLAQIIERTLGTAALEHPTAVAAGPEVVALAALVINCLRDPALVSRVARADSLDEVLDCLAADRLMTRTELAIDPAILSEAGSDDLVRIVLDHAIRPQVRT
mgnify:CR=1 FL=1